MTREEFWCNLYLSKYKITEHDSYTATEFAMIVDADLAEFDKRFTPEPEASHVFTITNPPKFEQLFDGVEFEGGVAYLEFQENELCFVYTPQNMSPDCFYVPKQVNDKNYPVWWGHNASTWLTDIFSEIETGGMN